MKKINELIDCDYDINIKGISDDSRNIKEGYLFVATKGYNEDHFDYIEDAIKNGCSFVICDRKLDISFPHIVVDKINEVFFDICLKYYGVDLNDYIQEGRIAVFKAMKSFDVNGASLFYTYVCLCINRCLITYCRSLGASKNFLLNNSLSDETYSFLGDIEYEPSIFVGNMYSDKAIIDYKNTLDFLDSTIFELRYNGFSYIEIGTLLDISSTTVARHLCKIKKTLQGIKDKF